MATIKEHNNLVKVVFGQEKYYKHVMTNDAVRKIVQMQSSFPISRLPVCGHCERLGTWHTGHSCYCRVCGSLTHDPITFAEYYTQGYDMGDRNALESQQELTVRSELL